jgi:hypothetical protein
MQKYGHTITSQNNYRLSTNCLITIFCIDDSVFGDTESGICENLAVANRDRGLGVAVAPQDARIMRRPNRVLLLAGQNIMDRLPVLLV